LSAGTTFRRPEAVSALGIHYDPEAFGDSPKHCPHARHGPISRGPDGAGRGVDHDQRGRRCPPLRPVPVHPPQPRLLDPGRLCRALDPLGPEPPGRAGNGRRPNATGKWWPAPRLIRVPGPGGGVHPHGTPRSCHHRRAHRRRRPAGRHHRSQVAGSRMSAIEALLFDFGGVITSSPFELMPRPVRRRARPGRRPRLVDGRLFDRLGSSLASARAGRDSGQRVRPVPGEGGPRAGMPIDFSALRGLFGKMAVHGQRGGCHPSAAQGRVPHRSHHQHHS